MPILLKLFKKLKREHFLTHSMRPAKPGYQSQTKGPQEKSYRPISHMNIYDTIFNKILANGIQQHIKRIIHHDQVEFIPGIQGLFST